MLDEIQSKVDAAVAENKIKNMKLYYSLISGVIYEIPSDEIKNQDKYQVPLKKRPSSSCRKCYGRGYIGKNLKMDIFQLCNCMQKCIDFSNITDEVTVDTPKTTTELDLNK